MKTESDKCHWNVGNQDLEGSVIYTERMKKINMWFLVDSTFEYSLLLLSLPNSKASSVLPNILPVLRHSISNTIQN